MRGNIGASMRLRGEVSTASVHQGSGASATTNTQNTMQPKTFLSIIWRISASKPESCNGKINRMRAFASTWERTCTDLPRNISTSSKPALVKSCSLGFPAQGRRLASVIPGDANCFTTSLVGAGRVSRCASCTAAAAMGERWEPSSPAGFLLGDINDDDDDDDKGGAEEGLGADLGRASSKGRDRRRGGPVYAVACGRKMGIFYKWEEAELAVRGFSGAVYKKFSTERAARRFIESRTAPSANGGGEPGSAASANGSGALPVTLKPQPSPEPIGPFYAVARGHQSGVFLSWAEAKAAVQGAAGVAYKRFNTRAEAEHFLAQHRQAPPPLSTHTRGAPEPAEAAGPGPGLGKSVKRPGRRRRKEEARSGSDTAAAAAAVTAAPAGVLNEDRFDVVRNKANGDGGGGGSSSECCQLTEGAAVDGEVQKPLLLVAEAMEAAVTSHTATDSLTNTATGSLWPPGQLPEGLAMGCVNEVPDWSTEWQGGPAPTYYAVARGKQVGIYTSWADARAAVEGVSGAQFRRFKRLSEAYAFLTLASPQQQQQQLEVGPNHNSVPAGEARRLPGGVSITAAISRTNECNGDGGSAVGWDIQDGGIKMDGGVDAGGGGGRGGGEGHAACSTINTRCCSDKEAEQLHDGEGALSVQRARVGVKAAAKATAEAETMTAEASCGSSAVAEAEVIAETWEQQQQQQQQLKDDEGGEEMMMEEEEEEEEEEEDGELLDFGGLTGKVDSSRTYRLEFDGGSRRNPGDAGFGAVLVDVVSGRHVEYVAGPLSSSSNNVAEWSALVAGVQVAIDMGVRHLVVQGDSELVCRQVSGRYGVNTPALQPLAARVCRLRGKLDSFDVVHVPRSANAAADLLSNLAMDAEEVVAAVVSEHSVEPPSAAAGLQPRRRRRVQKELRDHLQPIIRELGEPALQGARAAIAAAVTAATTLSEAALETTSGTETACLAPASETVAVQSSGGGPGTTPGKSRSRQEGSPTPPAGAGGRHGRRVQVLVTECAPPVAARGSVAGSMEDFKRVLIAMACVSHGLLE